LNGIPQVTISKLTIPPWLRANQYLLLDVFIILLLCIPLTDWVAGTLVPLERYVIWGDNPWYLNRGALLSRGLADGAFVYTLTYPVLVFLVNNLFHDLILTGIVINRIAHTVLIVGTYLLGRAYFNRRVAWLATLLISMNSLIFIAMRITQSYPIFYALVVVCVLVYTLLVHRPGVWTAALFGLTLTVTFYTRLEGISYSLLIPLAVWQIYRSRKSVRVAVLIGFISGLIVLIGAAFYFVVISRNSDPNNGVAFALLGLLRTQPFPWDVFLRRAVGTLDSLTSGWFAIVSIGALVGLIWHDRRERTGNLLMLLLIGINAANLFLLSIEPKAYIGAPSLTFLGLLFSAFLIRVRSRWQWGWSIAALAAMLVCLYGVNNIAIYAVSPREDYRLSRLGQDAVAVDTWLIEQGFKDTEVFTFCSSLISYSQSNFHLIYRLGIRDMHAEDWYNSPNQLLPTIHERGELFMRCPNEIYYRDWENFFADSARVDQYFKEIANLNGYIFYQIE
jgi:4-amino-4-deoxy-L-arabinose transferase-like glycosyltransferase